MPNEIICPNCGSHVRLPEHGSIATGMTIGREDGNNTFILNMEENNMPSTLETLRNNGVDVSNLVEVNGIDGVAQIMRREDNGVYTLINDIDSLMPNTVDPIEQAIFENGYVRNTMLHRRFVMGQMFHMLNYVSNRNGIGYTAALKAKGYNYQWKMMKEEIRVIGELEKSHDKDAFKSRTRFFNKNVVDSFFNDYMIKLREYVNNTLKEHKCHGVLPYKYVPRHGNVFCADMYKKVYKPISKYYIDKVMSANTYTDMYYGMCRFERYYMIKLPENTPMCDIWVNAYKGAGAYYTLDNLIKFHNCYVRDFESDIIYDSVQSSLDYVNKMTDKYRNEYYKLLALLKKTIKDNNFDYKARMIELHR